MLEIRARGALIDLGFRDVAVASVQEAEWHDTSLACGPVEGNNPAVAIKGWIITFQQNDDTWKFHVANNGEDEIIINCTDAPVKDQNIVNLVEALKLRNASKLTFSRGNGEGGYSTVGIVEDAPAVAEFIDALDISIPIENTELCETTFKLDFATPDGTQSIHFFCEDDWFRIGGEHPLWNEAQGAMPRSILDLISPFLAAQPMPSLPPDPE